NGDHQSAVGAVSSPTLLTHAVHHQPFFLGGSHHDFAAGAHAEGVNTTASDRVVACQGILSRGQTGVRRKTILDSVDQLRRVFHPQTDGKRFALQAHPHSV